MSNYSTVPRKVIGAFTIFERVPKPHGATKYFVVKEGGGGDTDFGRFSVAVRFAKMNTPRPTPHIIIFDDKSAVSTVPVNYTIMDPPHRFDAAAAVDPAMVAGVLNLKPEQQQ